MIGLMHMRRFRQSFQRNEILIQPFAVRMLRHDFIFYFLIGNDTALFGVYQEYAARLKTPFMKHILGSYVHHTDFGGHDDQIVLRHVITRRAQSVSIQNRADLNAVCKCDRRGTVPRLHQRAVIFIKGLFLVAHTLVVRPGLWNHHHDRVRQ